MEKTDEIINRVAESGIITIDLEDFYPKEEIVELDIKPFLFGGMILKEKDFRLQLKEFDWNIFAKKNVAIFCSADAIIPRWAFMLLATYLQPIAHKIFAGTNAEMAENLTLENLKMNLSLNDFSDKRIVVKGCGEKQLSAKIYTEITTLLLPFAKSIMYGEACSSVPVFKKRNQTIHER